MNNWDKLESSLRELYTDVESLISSLKSLKRVSNSLDDKITKKVISEKDVNLICYADTFYNSSNEESPLKSLSKIPFEKVFSSIHLLPFYPWDTDRGFSVKDYYQVDTRNGNWDEISELSAKYDLMFDFVANHASVDNEIVQKALISNFINSNDYNLYKDFVITYTEDNKPSNLDLEKLARPRANPVLTPYVVYELENASYKAMLGAEKHLEGKVLGQGYVWTTFSRGLNSKGEEQTRQVDLNFKNKEVFLEVIKILLFYKEKGARYIRLDAIGYLWKILGSSSLHEKQTHKLIHCIYLALELLEAGIVTVAEVNEKQENAFKYLGTVTEPESDLVYQFTHFPLAIHAVHFKTAKYYNNWLKTLSTVKGKQFITVLGSHDGLGMKPLRGVLPESEIEKFGNYLVEKHKALANYAILPGGKKIVYEACATPWNLINISINNGNEVSKIELDKYLLVFALGLIPRGLPGIYINGALGTSNYQPPTGLDENRTINRERFDIKTLKLENEVYKNISNLLEKRASLSAFNPFAPSLEVMDFTGTEKENDKLVVVKIPSKEKGKSITFVGNISEQETNFELDVEAEDLISSKKYKNIKLSAYQFAWFKEASA